VPAEAARSAFNGIARAAAAPAAVMAVVVGVALGVAFDPTRGTDAVILLGGMGALCALATLQMKRATRAASTASAVPTHERLDGLHVELERSRAGGNQHPDGSSGRERLHADEVHFRALVETSGDIVWAVDQAGCYTYVNGAALEAILGYRAEEVIGFPITQFADPVSAQAFDDEFYRLSESGGTIDVGGLFRRRDGHPVHLSIRAIALHDDAGRFIGASGTAVDVSNLKAAESQLRQSLAEQEAILDSATVGIAIVDEGIIVRANRELARIFGYAAETMTGLPIGTCFPEGSETAALLPAIEEAVAARGVYDEDVTCRRSDTGAFWCRIAVRRFDQAGARRATIWIVQDVSDRKQKEQAVIHASLHDALTGLPNRALLSDRLEQAIRHAARAGTRFGVLFLDLDRFKVVNDTVGHDGGDELLRVIAERLRRRVRASDTVARQGGDEFIVMLPDVRSSADVERIAADLLAEIAKPIPIFGTDYVVTGSIGICLYPEHGADATSLLRNADAAMYRAKDLGKNGYRFFSEELHLQALEDMRLENLLRAAIESEQLAVHYQPRIDLVSGRVSSLEALARWHHPGLGWIEPTRFIAIAERAGLVGRLGEWVLRKACNDLAELSRLGFRDLGLSVNVSHCQLAEPQLASNVREILAEFGIEPQRLELELTETAIARNAEQAVTIMESLEASGIGVAIDDFGTGYSSLSRLKRFPVRTIKIDRSFVETLPHDQEDVAIALAIIAMAKRLRMRVVAEGVETTDQREFLRRNQCDQAQGFLFSRAVPFTKIVEYLRPHAPGGLATVTPFPRRVAAAS
jgi:diguanylate cyclase (GGDEF)-like protein/PAS domain S-box-containing protein